eukprot:5193968-Heterocapsa_arctica.AAC.1
MGYRDLAPVKMCLMDGGLPKSRQPTRKKWDQYSFRHVELEARHDSIFIKSPENLVSGLRE